MDESCNGFNTYQSYCVEAYGEPTGVPTGSPTTAPPTAKPTSTKPSNGVTTPLPTQPGMIENCNKFHLQVEGEYCADMAGKYGITLKQFTTWNSGVGDNCQSLWADAYFCVGVIGFTPTPTPTKVTATTKPTTTTKPGNGITTPLPTQPGMVSNCNKFYLQKPGEYCSDMASKSGISLKQFTTWNTGVGDNCQSMWADAYFCVGIVGFTPTPTPTKATTTAKPTTTKPGNGVATPTPIQSGMVSNCKTFYFVKKDQTCANVLSSAKVTLANLFKWNPAVKSDCSGLWAETWTCVGVL